jgi:hypothetical protein
MNILLGAMDAMGRRRMSDVRKMPAASAPERLFVIFVISGFTIKWH